MEAFLWMIMLVMFGLIGLGISQSIKNNKNKKNAIAFYNSLLLNFRSVKTYIQPNGLCMLALNNDEKKILIANTITDMVLNYSDILKSEMIVDGQMVSSKSAGASLAGGLLFGTVGAVVGSNAGQTRFSKDVKSVSLKIFVRNPVNPTHELAFYQKIPSNNITAEQAQKDCQVWQDTITVAIAN